MVARAGALSASHEFNLPLGIAISVIACPIADGFWYYLGRRCGTQVLGLLCRISLEPDSCVRRTLDVFSRYGMRGVVVAKFVPAMSTITPPLAGVSGLGLRRFFFFDGLGSLLYCGLFILLGYFFANQITQIGVAVSHISSGALKLLAWLWCYTSPTNTGGGNACCTNCAWHGLPWRNCAGNWMPVKT